MCPVLSVRIHVYVPSAVSQKCKCLCQVLSVRVTLRESAVSAWHYMSQVLSVCATVCVKCCQCVPLYLSSAVCMCATLCAKCCQCATMCQVLQCVQTYVPSVVSVCYCISQVLQCVQPYVPNTFILCHFMCQVLSVCAIMYQVLSMRATLCAK